MPTKHNISSTAMVAASAPASPQMSELIRLLGESPKLDSVTDRSVSALTALFCSAFCHEHLSFTDVALISRLIEEYASQWTLDGLTEYLQSAGVRHSSRTTGATATKKRL